MMRLIRVLCMVLICCLVLLLQAAMPAMAGATSWRLSAYADPNCDVTFYGDLDAQGWIANLYIGDTASIVNDLGFPNDDLSSISIHNHDALVVLYPHEYYEDYYLALGTETQWNLDGFAFNDICSSFYICRQGEQYPNFLPDDSFNYDENNAAETTSTRQNDYPAMPDASTPLPDLVAGDIICLTDEQSRTVGYNIQFDSSIKNQGQRATDTNFNIKWFVDDKVLGYGGHDAVAANTEVFDGNSQFSFTPAQKGLYLITFYVDCDDFIDEVLEANNLSYLYVTIK